MKEFLKDLFDFVLEELVLAAQAIMVAIGIFAVFAAYNIYLGG